MIFAVLLDYLLFVRWFAAPQLVTKPFTLILILQLVIHFVEPRCIHYTPWRWTYKGRSVSEYVKCQQSDNLMIYECKCRCLLDTALLVHGCEQDKVYTTVCHRTEGTQKFPELLKKIYWKYLYKFETLVSFEVLPLWLDAAIPAPLPMLETLSKIFNGNAVKGR